MKKGNIKQRILKIAKSDRLKKCLPAALCALAVIAVLILALLLFPVREFEIKGETKYDVNDLVDASGIRTGNRLYFVSSGKAEKKILESCPYVESVEVKKVFPNKIRFEIVEKTSGWYIQVGDDYYALDYDMMVLSETYNEQALKDRGLTKLVLPELGGVVIGEYPAFGKGDERLISETLKIIDGVRTRDIKDRLDMLDLSNRFYIKMTVDGSFEIDFGDMDGADTKFDTIEQAISMAHQNGYEGGVITFTSPSEYSFRGYYADADADSSENLK